MSAASIKFLDAYEKRDKEIFFGREGEIDVLYRKVRRSCLTLLYGLSGTGKTSLVRCGLANKFNEADWFELYVRRGDHILKSLRSRIEENADTLVKPSEPIFKALEALYLDFFKPIYIIFDQFEELFISGTKTEQAEFIRFLSQLVDPIIDNQSYRININVKVIIILREEYFTFLDSFEEYVPSIFDSRMRLERMSRKKLEEVIKNITKKGNITIENEEENINKIINNISEKTTGVELPYLQVYLDKLYRAALNSNTTISTKIIFDTELIDKAGKLDDVLGSFLEEQVKEIGKSLGDERIAWKILKSLITTEGTKKIFTLDELRKRFNE